MAGGLFDYCYAGGFGYSALTMPRPDLRSIFLDQSISLTAMILGLNEDFVEFALMPMLISTTNDEPDITRQLIQNSVEKISKIKLTNPKIHAKTDNNGKIDGNGFANFNDNVRNSHKGLADFLNEVKNDGFVENLVEKIGQAYAGSAGAALAGMIHDAITSGRVNSANVAEAVYGEFKGLLTRTAVSSGVRALGTSISPIGLSLVGGAIASALNEAFEIATGLDRHYGFGGELNAVVGNTAFYDRNFSFFEGIKDLFGGLNDKAITQVNKDGTKITGVRIGKDVYGYVKSTDNYGKNSFSLRNIDPQKAIYDNLKRESFNALKAQDRTLSNMEMDAFGNVSFGINTRDYLKSVGALNFSDILGSELKAQIENTLANVVSPTFTRINSVMGVGVTTNVNVGVNVGAGLTTSAGEREIFSRNKDGGFSFSNTEAGNYVEALGKVGFGKGYTSIADEARAHQLARELKGQKDRATQRERNQKSSGKDLIEDRNKYGHGGFDNFGRGQSHWGGGFGGFGRGQSEGNSRDWGGRHGNAGKESSHDYNGAGKNSASGGRMA